MTTIEKAKAAINDRSAAILNLSYGVSTSKLHDENRDDTVENLSNLASAMLLDINGDKLYDCELAISEGKGHFSVGVYLLEFNGQSDDHEVTKLRMVESLESVLIDAVNKAEADNKDNSSINKIDYIKAVTDFIDTEIVKLSPNMSLLGSGYISARLNAHLSESAFEQNETANYFDRLNAVTNLLNTDYWSEASDGIISSSLYGAESVLRKVAAELGLYGVIYDTSGRQVAFGDLVEHSNSIA